MGKFFGNLWSWFKSLFTRAEAAPVATPAPICPVVTPVPSPKPVSSPVIPPRTPYQNKIVVMLNSAALNPAWAADVNWAARQCLVGRERYEEVADTFGFNMPWWVPAAFHMRESSFDFTKHLANGDDLFDQHGKPLKTTRPPANFGPFSSWEEAAVAALRSKFDGSYHWDPVNFIENAEMYNGMGYKNAGLVDPYCWAMTNWYKSGKYTDAGYDPNVVDKQPGVAALLISLKQGGIVGLG